MDQYLSRNSNSNIHEIGSVNSLDNGLEKSKQKQKKKLQKVTLGIRETKPQSSKLMQQISDVKFRTSSNFFPSKNSTRTVTQSQEQNLFKPPKFIPSQTLNLYKQRVCESELQQQELEKQKAKQLAIKQTLVQQDSCSEVGEDEEEAPTGIETATESNPLTSEDNLSASQQQVFNEQTEEKKKLIKKRGPPKPIMNIHYTQYPIVKIVARQLGFRCRTDDINILALAGADAQPNQPPVEDFDVCWIDCAVPAEALAKLKPYQRLSQFPGIQAITNKSKLARNLTKMKRYYPEDYSFFPQTYLLPVEINEFRNQLKFKREIFIVKPEALCQGRGIYLVNEPSQLTPDEHLVAQRYLSDPYLLDGLKFDLRIYVLLYGVNPLRIFIYNEGLVRLATERYVQPTEGNMRNLFMHLTNYAINKNSNKFIENEDDDGSEAHKRSLSSLFQRLKEEGHDINYLKSQINDIIIKTIIVAQPSLAHIYRTCQSDDVENQSCFQILGFDIILDSKLKPWLLEVNQSPSFKTDAGLDARIKGQLIYDTIRLLNISFNRKMKFISKYRQELKQRMLTGKKLHLSGEQREEVVNRKEEQRSKFELSNLGDYQLIYPPTQPSLMQYYKTLIDQACFNWEEFTTGRRKLPHNKVMEQKQNKPLKVIAQRNSSVVQKFQNVKDLPNKGRASKNEPLLFRNTFANEMRSLAQSQLVKQLDKKRSETIVKLDEETVYKISEFNQKLSKSPKLEPDTSAFNFVSGSTIKITTQSNFHKPPKQPISSTKNQLMWQSTETLETPTALQNSKAHFLKFDPPSQPQFSSVTTPKQLFPKLQRGTSSKTKQSKSSLFTPQILPEKKQKVLDLLVIGQSNQNVKGLMNTTQKFQRVLSSSDRFGN